VKCTQPYATINARSDRIQTAPTYRQPDRPPWILGGVRPNRRAAYRLHWGSARRTLLQERDHLSATTAGSLVRGGARLVRNL